MISYEMLKSFVGLDIVTVSLLSYFGYTAALESIRTFVMKKLLHVVNVVQNILKFH